MEISPFFRDILMQSVKKEIDGTLGHPGYINFYDKDVNRLAKVNFANPSMTINNGVGTFTKVTPYMRGTVERDGTASYWELWSDVSPTYLLKGTCGDIDNLNHDIIFSSHGLVWITFDVIIIETLTLTIPSGSNNYL